MSWSSAVARPGNATRRQRTNGLTETRTVDLEWNDNDQTYGAGVIWFDAGTDDVVDSAAIS
jgi:hypothetical protein